MTDFELLETMLYDPCIQFYLLSRHLNRLDESFRTLWPESVLKGQKPNLLKLQSFLLEAAILWQEQRIVRRICPKNLASTLILKKKRNYILKVPTNNRLSANIDTIT